MAKENSVELIKIIPYKDGDMWYMELVYEIRHEDGSIRHRIFPKVMSPFMSTRVAIRTDFSIFANRVPEMNLYDDHVLIYKGMVTAYRDVDDNDINIDNVLYADILMKKPDTREMTLAEIEKELGYPVKIIRGDE